jgi:hypothetical protein
MSSIRFKEVVDCGKFKGSLNQKIIKEINKIDIDNFRTDGKTDCSEDDCIVVCLLKAFGIKIDCGCGNEERFQKYFPDCPYLCNTSQMVSANFIDCVQKKYKRILPL